MLLAVTLITAPVQTNAASKKAKAMKAYKSYVAKVRKEQPKSKFATAYVNNDDIPELFVISITDKIIELDDSWEDGTPIDPKHPISYETNRTIHTFLYTYTGKKMILVNDFKTISNYNGKKRDGYNKDFSRIKSFYYKKTGVFSVSRHDPDACADIQYYHSMKIKTHPIATAEKEGSAKNNYYYIYKKADDHKRVSKKDFNKHIRKYTKGKKATTVKFVNNTAANAKKKLK